MIVEWDIIAFNGIIHAIAEPLRIPPPVVHLGQVSVQGHEQGRQMLKELVPGLGMGMRWQSPPRDWPCPLLCWPGCLWSHEPVVLPGECHNPAALCPCR